jgi:hypothetical protein
LADLPKPRRGTHANRICWLVEVRGPAASDCRAPNPKAATPIKLGDCMMWKNVGLLAAAALILAACGSTPTERGVTGAGIGAATGAAAGALGGEAGTGALIGGAAGAATGALTDEETIDLGEPLWERF